jgi:hypothetical protein
VNVELPEVEEPEIEVVDKARCNARGPGLKEWRFVLIAVKMCLVHCCW